jgi:hypothetical protein
MIFSKWMCLQSPCVEYWQPFQAGSIRLREPLRVCRATRLAAVSLPDAEETVLDRIPVEVLMRLEGVHPRRGSWVAHIELLEKTVTIGDWTRVSKGVLEHGDHAGRPARILAA